MELSDEEQAAAEEKVKRQSPVFTDRGIPGESAFTHLRTTLAHLTPEKPDEQE